MGDSIWNVQEVREMRQAAPLRYSLYVVIASFTTNVHGKSRADIDGIAY